LYWIVPVPDSVPTSIYSFLPPNFYPKIPLTFISNRITLSAYLQAECLDPNKKGGKPTEGQTKDGNQ